MSHVATATHEVRGTLIWDNHGDSPYWALRSITHKLDGGTTFQTTIDDEPIQITLSYSASGISPRPTDNVDQLYEYGIYWTTEDGQRYGGEVKPRFQADEFRQYQPDRAFHDRDQINVPESLGEAVAFQVTAGTYQPPDYYTTMLPKVLLELAREAQSSWNADYLASVPHEFSTITALEQTVRLTRSESLKLTNSDGIMGRLFFLLANSEGSKVEYSADNTETIGYIHQLRLDDTAASELFPGRRSGFQFKSYHPKHVRSNTEDPLYHPRVGVLFRKSLNSTGGIPWNDWPALVRELEETMMNILQWANIPIQPGPTFVPDDHYDVQESEIDIGFFDDPTPMIEREQDNIVMRVLARANDSAWDIAEDLTADGEEHYSRFDLSTSSAYRALEELEGIVESQAGVFRFVSEKIRQDVQALVDQQRRRKEDFERGVFAIAHLLDINPQRLQERGSALQRWLTKYAIELDDRDDRTVLKIQAIVDRLRSTSVPRLEELLREGLGAWRDAGLDPEEFYTATIVYEEPDGTQRTGIVRASIR